ncbi:uncharacterized protein LOC131933718 [Physella acuta]|uniref:uncharacterized protein LOC131933718 n=1 Tax=Physella acuta TaxID=109671 RepID=UPI0027DDC8D2|nr:uncharacterized protein LOC131933718 [Physella acuta]XP_059146324.1 uncharacterized protein LOC131933718 [Physella acuta]XP_059146325.1 uncharacterized protein LOC131933718 [Physella acuta]
MAKILLLFAAAALCVCFITAQSGSTTELTSEQHIKNLVDRVVCSDCEFRKRTLMSKTHKNDTCTSFSEFRTCLFIFCTFNIRHGAITEAQEICDGCSALQMSMLVLFMASIVKILF